MLPYRLSLDELDDGIRDLVINLNRIPGVYTNTTCEGHIWRDIPAWPTKDGWIHLNVSKIEHTELIPRIRNFVVANSIFELEGPNSLSDERHNHYIINGLYESHDNGQLFDRINLKEREDYFKRAEKRREELLKGWGNLNTLVIQYIKDNITLDYLSLKFRDSKPSI